MTFRLIYDFYHWPWRGMILENINISVTYVQEIIRLKITSEATFVAFFRMKEGEYKHDADVKLLCEFRKNVKVLNTMEDDCFELINSSHHGLEAGLLSSQISAVIFLRRFQTATRW